MTLCTVNKEYDKRNVHVIVNRTIEAIRKKEKNREKIMKNEQRGPSF